MKQTNEKKIRQKMPKKQRYAAFFLRRLPLTAAAAVICDTVFFGFRWQAEQQNDCKTQWDNICAEYFTEQELDPGYSVSDADFAFRSYGMDGMLARLTTCTDYETLEHDVFTEISVMMTDTGTGEYTISAPVVFTTVMDAEDGQEQLLYAGQAESEEIAEALMKADRKHYLCDYFGAKIYQDGILHAAEDITGRLWERTVLSTVPLHAYVSGDRFCSAEYGSMTGGRIRSTQRSDTAQPEGWQPVTNPYYVQKGGSYIRDPESFYAWKDSNAGQPYFSGFLRYHGCPAAARSGKAVQQVAALMNKKLPPFLENYQNQKKQSGTSGGVSAYTPEEQAASVFRDIWSMPGSCCAELTDSPFSKAVNGLRTYSEDGVLIQKDDCPGEYTENGVRYYADTRKVQLDGKTYSLFVCMTREPLKKCLLQTALFSIQPLLCAIVLALLWAMFSHLRARRKYETEEYRRSLTAALAHDLKSPLTAISGYAENLSSGVRPEKQAHYSASILQGTQYMDSIITNVLDLAKLEQNTKARKQKIELVALLREIHANRQDEIEARKLNVQITGSCTVKADPLMMIQALRNLLDNAVKFTPDGGSITVTGEGSTLRLVNDIAEDKVANVTQLCEAFVRGDSARSNQKGTGLGLSVVRQIAELNRLRLGIESSGHRFTVTLRGKKGLRR